MIELDGTENKSKFGANWECPWLSAELVSWKRVCPFTATLLTWRATLSHPVSPSFQCDQWRFSCWQQAVRARVNDPDCGDILFPGSHAHWSRGLPQPEESHQGEVQEGRHQCGGEGGLAPNILENKEALELLKTAIAKAGYTDQVVIRMDVAASEFYRPGRYDLHFKSPDDSNRYITPDQLADLYKSFIQNYPVVSFEDPFDQDDWDAWQKFTASAGIQVVGSDLTVTKRKRTA